MNHPPPFTAPWGLLHGLAGEGQTAVGTELLGGGWGPGREDRRDGWGSAHAGTADGLCVTSRRPIAGAAFGTWIFLLTLSHGQASREIPLSFPLAKIRA